LIIYAEYRQAKAELHNLNFIDVLCQVQSNLHLMVNSQKLTINYSYDKDRVRTNVLFSIRKTNLYYPQIAFTNFILNYNFNFYDFRYLYRLSVEFGEQDKVNDRSAKVST